MNKKGQMIIYGVMLFAMAFIAATLMLKPLMNIADDARDADSLGCDLDNKTQGTYLACIGVDLFVAFFYLSIIAGAAGLIAKSQGGG